MITALILSHLSAVVGGIVLHARYGARVKAVLDDIL